MIIRITCSCGEVTELAQPQAQRLKNCPACGSPLQKSAAEHRAAENFFDAPLLSCPTSLLTAWHFVVGIGLLSAAVLFVTVLAPAVESAHPMWISAGLLAASGTWLATGFGLLAGYRWATSVAKCLNAAGALFAILVIATWFAHVIMRGPASFLEAPTWLAIGPMFVVGPVCLWVLLRLETTSALRAVKTLQNMTKSPPQMIA